MRRQTPGERTKEVRADVSCHQQKDERKQLGRHPGEMLAGCSLPAVSLLLGQSSVFGCPLQVCREHSVSKSFAHATLTSSIRQHCLETTERAHHLQKSPHHMNHVSSFSRARSDMKLTRALSTLVQKEQGGLYLQLLPFACLLLLAEMHYSQASCVQTEKKKKKNLCCGSCYLQPIR